MQSPICTQSFNESSYDLERNECKSKHPVLYEKVLYSSFNLKGLIRVKVSVLQCSIFLGLSSFPHNYCQRNGHSGVTNQLQPLHALSLYNSSSKTVSV